MANTTVCLTSSSVWINIENQNFGFILEKSLRSVFNNPPAKIK